MTTIDLRGRRVLLTHADQFMGPAFAQVFSECGAEVVADTSSLGEPGEARRVVERAGRVDILLLHLAHPAPSTPAQEVGDDEWNAAFEALVHPMPRLVGAVLPQMRERGGGHILLVGSASALRGMKRASTYSAARGAQLAYAQAVGVELARENIRFNAIAQNFVDNPTYFPPEVQANPAFQERLKREVPLGRLVSSREDALFAAYLCSGMADCFVGQVFPVCGGWAPR